MLFLKKIRQKKIINSGNAASSYYFARDTKGADIKALQEVVIKSGDAKWCCKFARDVEGADIKRLEEAVIKSGNSEYCYYFARDIEGADINALQEAVIKSGDTYACYKFARDIEGADINALQEAVIKSGDAEGCYYFAKDIKGTDIKALLDVIAKSGNAEYCKYTVGALVGLKWGYECCLGYVTRYYQHTNLEEEYDYVKSLDFVGLLDVIIKNSSNAELKEFIDDLRVLNSPRVEEITKIIKAKLEAKYKMKEENNNSLSVENSDQLER